MRRSSVLALFAASHLVIAPLAATLVVARDAQAIGVAPGNATPVQREQAQQKFVRGKDLYAQKKYEAALEQFRGSMEIVASPNARLFAARCLREMGRTVEAYVEFGRTAVEAKELASQDSRYAKTGESATAERKDLEPKLGFVTITVEHATDATTLKIGGEEERRAAWGEPAPLKPGTTEIVVETPGLPPVSKTVTVAAGEKTTLTVDAGGGGSTVSVGTEPKEATPSQTSSGGSDLKPYAYIAGGVGVAGLATFAIFGAMASHRYSTLKSECPTGTCPPSRNDEISGGKTMQTVANIGLVVGIVGVATGVTLFVLSGPSKSGKDAAAAPHTEVVAGPTWIGLSGAF